MPLTVKFLGAFRHLSGNNQLSLEFQQDSTVRSLIEQLSQDIPGLRRTFTDGDLNDARSNSLILINGTEISVLDGYETKLNDGDEVVLVPVVHGG
ncbi:MAG: MoaD/ThiS family protein [Methanocella sp.]|jgi:molybdopterin synthase sulfur carrier subunit